MFLVFCIDKQFGLSFDGKRQSRDIEVTRRIKTLFEGKKISALPYSKTVLDNVLEHVNYIQDIDNVSTDVLFIENIHLKNLDNFDYVYMFVWDKVYPQDNVFNESLLKNYELIEIQTFTGYSHEEITLKIYKKGEKVLWKRKL